LLRIAKTVGVLPKENAAMATDPVTDAFTDGFEKHRAELLRHCYRMLGCFADAEDLVQDTLLRAWRSRATYSGDAPLRHWLMRIATNACLNVLDRQRPRRCPQLDIEAAIEGAPLHALEADHWVTPAPDAQLFARPDTALELREQVSLAFLALLQRLPPKQRAALLLKDVVGWSSQEIAQALELTLSSVNSALHRARETMAAAPCGPSADPEPEILAKYVRCWEERDLEGLLGMMRQDIAFAMPPFATWFRGVAAVRGFLESPRFTAFWLRGLVAVPTRANGLPALAWYTPGVDGHRRPHSIHVMLFEAGRLAEATNFIGAHYLYGFDLPEGLPVMRSAEP
jgi:RNA polymerase sigma-70 factor, ECF subfamily